MLLGILNHIMDSDEPYAIVNRLLDALPSGSYLVVTHHITDIRDDVVEEIVRFWNESGGSLPLKARTRRNPLSSRRAGVTGARVFHGRRFRAD